MILRNRNVLTLLAMLAAAGIRPAIAQPGLEVSGRPVEAYQVDPAYRWQDPDAPKPEAHRPIEANPQPDVRPFAREVESAAQAAGVDPELVHAVIRVESAYRPDALSPKGAVGLMQLLPETALRYGVRDVHQVEGNLSAGTRHLRDLIDGFGDRLDLALAAYNAGTGAVRRHGNRIPPYAETQSYVPAVLKRYRPKAAQRPEPAPAPRFREYLAGTRLDPKALERLE